MDERNSSDKAPMRASNDLQSIFDATHDAIWIIDDEQCILQCNRMAEEMFGLTAGEMIGRHCWEIVHATKCPIPDCPFPRATDSHERESMELRVDTKWFEVTVDPIYDARGELSRAVHIIRDITARRQAEEALRESEERLRLVTKATSEDIWQLDLEGRVTYASDAVHDIFGYTPEETRELGFDAFFPEKEIPRAREAFLKAASGEKHQILEFDGRKKDGSTIPIEVTVAPLVRNEEVVGVQGIARDISERKRTEAALREQKTFMETLLDTTPDTIYIYDIVEKKNIYSSQSIGAILGYSVEEIQSMGEALLSTLMHSEDMEGYLTSILPRYAEAADGEFIEHEYRMLHRDGSWRWLRSKESIFNRLENGAPKQIFGVLDDVTAHKKAERDLSESEERYRLLFENIINGFALHEIVVDETGTPVDYVFLEVNSAFEKLTGLQRDQLIGSRVTEVLPGIAEDPADWIGRYGKVALKGSETRFEQFAAPLGRWYSVLAFCPRTNQFATIFDDITEKREAERALQASEQRLRIAGQAAYDLIYEWDVATDSLEWFGDIDGLLGFEPYEVSRSISAWLALIHPDDQPQLQDAVELHRNSTDPIQYYYRIRHQDGTYRIWNDHALPMLNDAGMPERWIGVCTDITERKQAEKALQKSENLFRSITEQMSDMIFLTDDEGNITFVSPASQTIFGCNPGDMTGRPFTDFLDPSSIQEALAAYQRAIQDNIPSPAMELLMRRADGTTFHGELTGQLYARQDESGTIGVIRDVTDRHQAQEEKLVIEAQLRQSQKLESIGTLASGVAHEVNNPLTGIINYAELIKDRVEDDERAHGYAREIIHEGNRIATIVRNLLAFSRQDEAEEGLAQPSDLVAASLSLVSVMLRNNQIEVEVDVPGDLPAIRCRSQQIEQVLVNLITNALGALNDCYPGYHSNKTMSISAQVLESEWLRITVEDHGCGIPEEYRARVFDPFFTSKTRDQGTGLGLSVSHGIIKEHGGRLSFETAVGEFTRFFVDLPLPQSTG